MTKRRLKLLQKIAWFAVSVVCSVCFFWFLTLGVVRVKQLLKRSVYSKIPKSKQELSEAGKNVLGAAEEAATSEQAKKLLQQGIKFLETSIFTEPLRDLKESIVQKVNETVETVKGLPAKQVKTVKEDVCKQWLNGEVKPTENQAGIIDSGKATSSGEINGGAGEDKVATESGD